jgi:hypothetical protein
MPGLQLNAVDDVQLCVVHGIELTRALLVLSTLAKFSPISVSRDPADGGSFELTSAERTGASNVKTSHAVPLTL